LEALPVSVNDLLKKRKRVDTVFKEDLNVLSILMKYKTPPKTLN
jgi:hypothetical protein